MPRPLIILLALAFLPFSQNISMAQGDETKNHRAGEPLESDADQP